jgi:hypothetical protein
VAGDSRSRVVGNPASLIKVIRRSLRASAYAAGRLLLLPSKAHRNHRGRLMSHRFARSTHTRSLWPDRLALGGQLLMPLTNENG